MMNIAILLTVFNRKEKTLRCLDTIEQKYANPAETKFGIKVFLTDDASTDGTREAIEARQYSFPLQIIAGTGSLFWNGGMISSWKAALADAQDFDGYLWLNDDTEILPNFWDDLYAGDLYAREHYGRPAILVGSTTDLKGERFTYGGFNFASVITLKDVFLVPDGKSYQECQCAHGNITYIPKEVVERMGIFIEDYFHGGSDHDYTYLAYKAGFKLLVLPNYVGRCDNDHNNSSDLGFNRPTLKERLAYLHSPMGYNFKNALLFQKRCFPYRLPFVYLMGYAKAIAPRLFTGLYHWLRR